MSVASTMSNIGSSITGSIQKADRRFLFRIGGGRHGKHHEDDGPDAQSQWLNQYQSD